MTQVYFIPFKEKKRKEKKRKKKKKGRCYTKMDFRIIINAFRP